MAIRPHDVGPADCNLKHTELSITISEAWCGTSTRKNLIQHQMSVSKRLWQTTPTPSERDRAKEMIDWCQNFRICFKPCIQTIVDIMVMFYYMFVFNDCKSVLRCTTARARLISAIKIESRFKASWQNRWLRPSRLFQFSLILTWIILLDQYQSEWWIKLISTYRSEWRI